MDTFNSWKKWGFDLFFKLQAAGVDKQVGRAGESGLVAMVGCCQVNMVCQMLRDCILQRDAKQSEALFRVCYLHAF